MTRWIGLCLLAIALLVAVAPTGDPDVWWHLRTAEVALAGGSSLPVDVFSYSFAGQPWRYKDLLAEVILYGGFRLASFYWFVALKLAAALILFAALFFAGGRRGLLALAFTAGALSSFYLIERPELFSVMALPLLLMLLGRALRAREQNEISELIGYFLPVSILQSIWVNLHRASLIGYVLLAAFALGALLFHRAFSRRWLGAVWASLALALLLGPVNVSGWAAFRTGWTASQNTLIRQTISEWQPLTVAQLVDHFSALLGLLALAFVVCASALVTAARRKQTTSALTHGWNLLLLIGFTLLVRDSARWVTYLSLVAAFAGVNGAAELLVATRKWPRGLALLVGVALAALVYARRPAPFQLGEDSARLPVAAVGFARAHGLSGRVMNAFDLGGYLIWSMWPEARVFVDGRNETVYSPQFLAQAARSESDAQLFESIRARDGATWVMATNAPGRGSHRFLAQNQDWGAVFWSEAAVIYVLRAAHPEMEPLRYRLLNPLAPVESVRALRAIRQDFPLLEAELFRLLSGDPASVRGHVALFIYYDSRGPDFAAKRDQVLRRLLVLAPDHPVVRQIAAQLR